MAGFGPLRGTTIGADEVPAIVDELPLIAVLGCYASGVTEVRGLHHIDRGYEAFDTKLVSLGADVERVEGDRRSDPATA